MISWRSGHAWNLEIFPFTRMQFIYDIARFRSSRSRGRSLANEISKPENPTVVAAFPKQQAFIALREIDRTERWILINRRDRRVFLSFTSETPFPQLAGFGLPFGFPSIFPTRDKTSAKITRTRLKEDPRLMIQYRGDMSESQNDC